LATFSLMEKGKNPLSMRERARVRGIAGEY
jgi:hypothetical protein